MRKSNLFTLTFIISYLTVVLGAILKILHINGASPLLGIGLLTMVLYVIIALLQIHNSDQYTSYEKWRWTIGFILFGSFAGVLYLVQRRER